MHYHYNQGGNHMKKKVNNDEVVDDGAGEDSLDEKDP